jgi:hypothetical protein
VLGGGKYIAPSDKVNVAVIGCGNQGKADVTQICDPEVPTVKKPGGLKKGEYEVEVFYTYSSSYMPPFMDTMMASPTKRKMVLVH